MLLIGRLFAASLGFLAAVIAAAVFLIGVSLGSAPADPVDAGWFWGMFAVSGTIAASAIGAFVAVPAAIAILVSELFAIRSFIAFALLGGALGLAAAAGMTVTVDGGPPRPPDPTILIASGFVGGLVYWLVAGRTAGFAPQRRTGGPPRV